VFVWDTGAGGGGGSGTEDPKLPYGPTHGRISVDRAREHGRWTDGVTIGSFCGGGVFGLLLSCVYEPPHQEMPTRQGRRGRGRPKCAIMLAL